MHCLVSIDDTYTVPVLFNLKKINNLIKQIFYLFLFLCFRQIGTVVSGLTLKGVIRQNDVLYLGPNKMNKFEKVVIRSIHRKRMPVSEVHSGQSASLALKKVKRNEVRKGMVLLAPSEEPKAHLDFYAEILILHHPTTICVNYQAMIHCGSCRQTATIISMNKECLRYLTI